MTKTDRFRERVQKHRAYSIHKNSLIQVLTYTALPSRILPFFIIRYLSLYFLYPTSPSFLAVPVHHTTPLSTLPSLLNLVTLTSLFPVDII